LLLQHVEVLNSYRETPLLLAAKRGHLGIARLLLAHGASASYMLPLIDETGKTTENMGTGTNSGLYVDSDSPLAAAAMEGSVEMIELLLQEAEGGDGGTTTDGGAASKMPPNSLVDLRNRNGRTALGLSVLMDEHDAVELLVRYGASVDHFDNRGFTPLLSAVSRGTTHSVHQLLSAGANPRVEHGTERYTPAHLSEARHISVARKSLKPLSKKIKDVYATRKAISSKKVEAKRKQAMEKLERAEHWKWWAAESERRARQGLIRQYQRTLKVLEITALQLLAGGEDVAPNTMGNGQTGVEAQRLLQEYVELLEMERLLRRMGETRSRYTGRLTVVAGGAVEKQRLERLRKGNATMANETQIRRAEGAADGVKQATACYEAHTKKHDTCSGYAACGYSCSAEGNYCAVMGCACDCKVCAEQAAPGTIVDVRTGRCVPPPVEGMDGAWPWEWRAKYVFLQLLVQRGVVMADELEGTVRLWEEAMAGANMVGNGSADAELEEDEGGDGAASDADHTPSQGQHPIDVWIAQTTDGWRDLVGDLFMVPIPPEVEKRAREYEAVLEYAWDWTFGLIWGSMRRVPMRWYLWWDGKLTLFHSFNATRRPDLCAQMPPWNETLQFSPPSALRYYRSHYEFWMTELGDIDDIYTALLGVRVFPSLVYSLMDESWMIQLIDFTSVIDGVNAMLKYLGKMSFRTDGDLNTQPVSLALPQLPQRLPEATKGLVMPLYHSLSAMLFTADFALDLIEDSCLLPFRFFDTYQHHVLNATLAALTYPFDPAYDYSKTVSKQRGIELTVTEDGTTVFRADGGISSSYNPLWVLQLLINRLRGGPERLDWVLHEAQRERSTGLSWRPTWGAFGGAKSATWMMREDGTDTARFDDEDGGAEGGAEGGRWWQKADDNRGFEEEEEEEEAVYGASWGDEWSVAEWARAHPRYTVTAIPPCGPDADCANKPNATTIREAYSMSQSDFFHPRVASRGLYAHVSDQDVFDCFVHHGGLLAIGFGSVQSYRCADLPGVNTTQLEHTNQRYPQSALGCNACPKCCHSARSASDCEKCAVAECGMPPLDKHPMSSSFLMGRHRAAMDACLMSAPSHRQHRSNNATRARHESTFRASWRSRFLDADNNPRVRSFLAGCANESSKVVYSVKNTRGGWKGDSGDPKKHCMEHRMQLLEQMYESVSDADLTECFDSRIGHHKKHGGDRASEAVLVRALDECLRASPSMALYHERVRANPTIDASTGGHLRFVNSAHYGCPSRSVLRVLLHVPRDETPENTTAEESGPDTFSQMTAEAHAASLKQRNPSALLVPYTGMHAGFSYLASTVIGDPANTSRANTSRAASYEYGRSRTALAPPSSSMEARTTEELESMSVDELKELSFAMRLLVPTSGSWNASADASVGDLQQRQVWFDSITDAIELWKAKRAPVAGPAELFMNEYDESVFGVDVEALEEKLVTLRKTTRTEYLAITELLDAQSMPMVLVALKAVDRMQMWLQTKGWGRAPPSRGAGAQGIEIAEGKGGYKGEEGKGGYEGEEGKGGYKGEYEGENRARAKEDLLVIGWRERALLVHQGAFDHFWRSIASHLPRSFGAGQLAAHIALGTPPPELPTSPFSIAARAAWRIRDGVGGLLGFVVFGKAGYAGEIDGQGRPHGLGTMVWTWGEFAKGSWSETTAVRDMAERSQGSDTMCTRLLVLGRVAQPCKYEGEWVHGRRHGYGKEWYADGSTKEVSSGWQNGSPDPAGTSFVNYVGERRLYVEVSIPLDEKMAEHAYGRGPLPTNAEQQEHETYVDAWVRAHGLRRATHEEKAAYKAMLHARRGRREVGSVYEGEKDDKGRPNGQGVENELGGGRYEGGWSHGMREGRGSWQHSHGASYEGNWRDGLKHGEGTAKFDDGSSYSGGWKGGEYEGFGEYSWANGNRYRGGWEASKKHGKGEYYSHVHGAGAGALDAAENALAEIEKRMRAHNDTAERSVSLRPHHQIAFKGEYFQGTRHGPGETHFRFSRGPQEIYHGEAPSAEAPCAAEVWVEGQWEHGKKRASSVDDPDTALPTIVHSRANRADGKRITMRFAWQAKDLVRLESGNGVSTALSFKIPQSQLAARMKQLGVGPRDALVLARAVGRWSLTPSARAESERPQNDMDGRHFENYAFVERHHSKLQERQTKAKEQTKEQARAYAQARARARAKSGDGELSTEASLEGSAEPERVNVLHWEPDFDFDFEIGEDSNGRRVYVSPTRNGWGVLHFRNHTTTHETTGTDVLSGEGSLPQLLLFVVIFHTLLLLALCLQCRVASVRITAESIAQEFLATGGPFVLYVVYLKTDEWLMSSGVDASRPLVQVRSRLSPLQYTLAAHNTLIFALYLSAALAYMNLGVTAVYGVNL
jgi:hypothetical protein